MADPAAGPTAVAGDAAGADGRVRPGDGEGTTTARGLLGPVLLALTWLAWFGVAQWSVPRFRVQIVLVLTAGTLLLGVWLWRRTVLRLPRWFGPAVIAGSVAVTLAVPLFSYLPDGAERAALAVLAAGALGCAVLLALPRPMAGTAALLAGAVHAVLAAVVVRADPAPRIDVWVILQQGADVTARLGNIYTAQWSDSPGVQDHFTYLPWMAVLTAPGRWVAGDVRWMLAVWTLVLLAGLWALAGGRGGDPVRGATLVALVVLAPGTLTQVDQAWTEPVLAALLVWWAVLVRRGHAWWAVVPLALACASKQHLALLAPLLLVWPAFGWRRTLVTGAAAGVLVSPWLVADPAAFVDDTVTTLLTFHPIRFANTWYLYFLDRHGVELPFVVTGLAMLLAVGAAVWAVRRRRPDVGEVLRWMALVLAVVNLVNKQAFYNQFWLVAVLVAASLAADAVSPRSPRAAAAAPASVG
ncbi:hypothetical protein [Phycicoccus flavus]|uniref:hypothetical protein n=1 Tax=Phycicoccus flavus TaxID=2502783 RepID=UPI000FEBF5C0|nr:hypothetical protein [Phycicoccus flavus]NHA67071.1 hypothetical protein [Phycicoccus flavus]